MFNDARLVYWLKGRASQNFGDLLSEVLYDALTRKVWFDRAAGSLRGDYDTIHLIGSVISNGRIGQNLEHARAIPGRRIAFWGCGMRDAKPIEPELLERCAFFGIRGPLSRDALGLPAETPLGDPGLLLPLLYRPRPRPDIDGKAVCIPHFLEPLADEALLEMTGADLVVRPNMPPDLQRVHDMIDIIAAASFVLSGAMHSAITACAYGSAFAFFSGGYKSIPFKWADFAHSAGFKPRFANSVADGIALFEHEIAPHIRKPPMQPLLACAPFTPPKWLLESAKRSDSAS